MSLNLKCPVCSDPVTIEEDPIFLPATRDTTDAYTFTIECRKHSIFQIKMPAEEYVKLNTWDERIVKALQELNRAVDQVVSLWDHTGTNMVDGYPSCLPSYEEFAAEIDLWVETQVRLRSKV